MVPGLRGTSSPDALELSSACPIRLPRCSQPSAFVNGTRCRTRVPLHIELTPSEINLIAARLKGKVEVQRQGKCVRVPGMEEFLADFASEASVAVSPHPGEVGREPGEEVATSPYPGEVGGEPAQEVAASPHPGEVGSEPALKVSTIADVREEEEEEDENRETHFKR